MNYHTKIKSFHVYCTFILLSALPLAADPARSRECLTVYEGYQTPAPILRGLALTESDGLDWAIGDDGVSLGRMQLNSRFTEARAAKWGSFDPHQPLDAVRIASCLYQANRRELFATLRVIDPSSWDGLRDRLAIAAHRQGVAGVRGRGADGWYPNRVESKALRLDKRPAITYAILKVEGP